MAYNPFDYIKQVSDEEAKEVVVKLRREGKSIRIRRDYYTCYGDDWDEWDEYLVVIEVMEKNKPLPSFTYKCHYTLDKSSAENFCEELKTIN